MRKNIFLLLTLIAIAGTVSAQNIYNLQNGKTILESDTLYYDVTDGDTLTILTDYLAVKFTPEFSTDSILAIENTLGLTTKEVQFTGWIIYQVPSTSGFIDMVIELLSVIGSSQLSFNYPLEYMSTAPLVEPDDPRYHDQWYHAGEFGIHTDDAWNLSVGNPATRVAVLDNGIDWGNEDLEYNDFGLDFTTIPPAPNPFPAGPSCWHGQMISTIIASKTNNNLDQSGIAGGWGSSPVTIIMCKTGNLNVNTFAAAMAIDYWVKRGVRIFNLSWGIDMYEGNCYTTAPLIEEAIILAHDAYGAVFLAASGKLSIDQGVAWPGCLDQVLSVAASNENGFRWNNPNLNGSSYGFNLDIAAPGTNIPRPSVLQGNPPYYTVDNSTSAATAVATGVAALMFSVNPCLSNTDAEYILKTTADKTGNYNYNWDETRPGHSLQLGYGKINAFEAVKKASDQTTEITAGQNVIFDEPRWFTHDLTIQNGGTLTVTSTIKFNEGCKIIVMQGGHLIVNGGTLTGSFCPGFWGGIEVRGNYNLAQYPTSNQGYVEINGGTIERANPGIYSSNGGLVVATDARFFNNKRAVILVNYPGWNHSILTRCDFKVSDSAGMSGNEYGIGAEFVHPLRITGCKFENTTTTMPYHKRGYGIISLDAEIHIYKAPPPPNCPVTDSVRPVFRQLAYGIYAMHSAVQHSYHLADAFFNSNMRGAYFSGYRGTSYLMAGRNDFFVLYPDNVAGNRTYGMYLDHCSGYTVESNDFYGVDEPSSGIGLIVNESGTDANEIYNNVFHNLRSGVQAQGCNRLQNFQGLCFRCNDFNENDNDIIVASEAAPGTPNQGICLSQGNKLLAAKNTFSEENDWGYDIYNPFDIISYFIDEFHGNYNLSPFPTFGVAEPEVIEGSSYLKVRDCPTYFGVPVQTGPLKEEHAAIRTEIDSLMGCLSVLVDNGSTEQMVNTVELSSPPEAVDLKNTLIAESPFLSDSVLAAAIEKELVLDNFFLTEVLTENPQAAKSEDLMTKLTGRVIAMPDSLMEEIMLGLDYLGAKEEMEVEIAGLKLQHSVAHKKLIHYYSQEVVAGGLDSLIFITSTAPGPVIDYERIRLFDQKGSTGIANGILDSIPFKYSLTETEQTEYEDFESLLPILRQIDSDPEGLESLDSLQIINLLRIAETGSLISGTYAKNILIKTDQAHYAEPVLDLDNTKSTKVWKKLIATGQSFYRSYVKVYPNPARDLCYVSVHFPDLRPDRISGSVTLTDLTGYERFRKPLNGRHHITAFSLKDLPSGLYLIQVQVVGKPVETISVIKH